MFRFFQGLQAGDAQFAVQSVGTIAKICDAQIKICQVRKNVSSAPQVQHWNFINHFKWT